MKKHQWCVFLVVLTVCVSAINTGEKKAKEVEEGPKYGDYRVRNALGAQVGIIFGGFKYVYPSRVPKKHSFYVGDAEYLDDPMYTGYTMLDIACRGKSRKPNYMTVLGLDSIKDKYREQKLTVSFSVEEKSICIPVMKVANWETLEKCDEDACFVCYGDNSTCADCEGTPWGPKELDFCHVCDGKNMDMDCSGVCFGNFSINECGNCTDHGNDDDCS